MLLKDEVQMLRRVPLFSGVDPTKLKLLAFTSDRVHYAAGEMLFRQGDNGDAAYVILTGRADILVEAPGGQIKVAEVENNSIVGEIAILCDVSRTATVKASTNLEALRISKDHFLKLLTDFPEMTIEIMRELASRLSRTTMELTDERARARKSD
ncbi:cyclic nucleotide-binding domain-containing protein [Rhizobium sp. GN54]|uniref:cyclic nucleotide-binding domain-containing protein n=1 Tax=Rhizobium sp. GN54 TaxID=2898150 RepID=UPI001E3655F4|nr:cyclic nucleotide-binding domain-containing protein [Rhizobium sp. GN54]MCD2180968.1 cyclic nucleotide-binding domain-containing protein [Rhizobium sp. GN54]